MVILRKLVLLFFSVFFIGIAYADEEVFLDLSAPEIHKFDTGKLKFENEKMDDDDNEDYLKPSFYTLKKMFDEDFRSDDKSSKKQNR